MVHAQRVKNLSLLFSNNYVVSIVTELKIMVSVDLEQYNLEGKNYN